MNLKERLPPLSAIIPVYALISFLINIWTIVVFLWRLPSWLYFLMTSEIFVIFSYAMAATLLESLVLLGILLLACAVIPPGWLRDVFVARGTLAAIFGIGLVMVYMYSLSLTLYADVSTLPVWTLAGVFTTIVLTALAARSSAMIRVAEWVSDRTIVFLLLSVPVSLISLIVVLYRNIF